MLIYLRKQQTQIITFKLMKTSRIRNLKHNKNEQARSESSFDPTQEKN